MTIFTQKNDEAAEIITKAIFGVIIACLLFVIVAALAIPLVLYSAFVLIKLWGWFVIPLLTPCMAHVPSLTYPIAIGLSLIVNMFRNSKVETNKEKPWLPYITAIAHITMIWFAGWVVHLFM